MIVGKGYHKIGIFYQTRNAVLLISTASKVIGLDELGKRPCVALIGRSRRQSTSQQAAGSTSRVSMTHMVEEKEMLRISDQPRRRLDLSIPTIILPVKVIIESTIFQSRHTVDRKKRKNEQNNRTQSSPCQATGQQNQAKSNPTSTRLLSGLLFPFPLSSNPNDCDLSSSLFKPCNSLQFRHRIMFNKLQVSQLEKRFHKQHYLTLHECVTLAHSIGLTPTQVSDWFRNHRCRKKRCSQDDSVGALLT
ncbi:Homeobox protein EgHBX3 [Taenia solium]|eukprot:TsM_000165400 transcript=TsM_000165400 gene=TsM_000165400